MEELRDGLEDHEEAREEEDEGALASAEWSPPHNPAWAALWFADLSFFAGGGVKGATMLNGKDLIDDRGHVPRATDGNDYYVSTVARYNGDVVKLKHLYCM
jgi:hypothetical protein